jgi:hypothetical protein
MSELIDYLRLLRTTAGYLAVAFLALLVAAGFDERLVLVIALAFLVPLGLWMMPRSIVIRAQHPPTLVEQFNESAQEPLDGEKKEPVAAWRLILLQREEHLQALIRLSQYGGAK